MRNRTVFRECLALIVGSHPEIVDRLPESDFAMCRILDLEAFSMNGWEDRKALKLILKERILGEKAVRPQLMEFCIMCAKRSSWPLSIGNARAGVQEKSDNTSSSVS